MEFSLIFYKEVPVDEDNICSLNLSENDAVDSVKYNKFKNIKLAGYLSTEAQALGFLPNVEGKKALSDTWRTYAAVKDKLPMMLMKKR